MEIVLFFLLTTLQVVVFLQSASIAVVTAADSDTALHVSKKVQQPQPQPQPQPLSSQWCVDLTQDKATQLISLSLNAVRRYCLKVNARSTKLCSFRGGVNVWESTESSPRVKVSKQSTVHARGGVTKAQNYSLAKLPPGVSYRSGNIHVRSLPEQKTLELTRPQSTPLATTASLSSAAGEIHKELEQPSDRSANKNKFRTKRRSKDRSAAILKRADLKSASNSDSHSSDRQRRRLYNSSIHTSSASEGNFFESYIQDAIAGTVAPKRDTSYMKIKPAPLLNLGDIEFYGNEFVDFVIYNTFFRKERHCNYRQSASPGESDLGGSATRTGAAATSDLRHGVYLETGASNGVHAANSLFFDHYLNWSGVLIEPSACALCQVPYNRPSAVSFRGGVCLKESMLNVSSPDFPVFCGRDQAGPDCCSMEEYNRPVRCSPLQSYIDEAGLETIDFMTIDIEHFYMEAMNTLDFNKTFVRVLLVECKTEDCYDVLKKYGYNYIQAGSLPGLGSDTIAWKNGYPPNKNAPAVKSAMTRTTT